MWVKVFCRMPEYKHKTYTPSKLENALKMCFKSYSFTKSKSYGIYIFRIFMRNSSNFQ